MWKNAPANERAWLPGRLALLLGLGAISATAATADTVNASANSTASRDCPAVLGDAVIRVEGGTILLSQRGGNVQRLQLPDTPQTRHLLALLRKVDPASDGLRLRPTILAGDGGSGFHWSPVHEPQRPKARRASTPKEDSGGPQQLTPPQGAPLAPALAAQQVKG